MNLNFETLIVEDSPNCKSQLKEFCGDNLITFSNRKNIIQACIKIQGKDVYKKNIYVYAEVGDLIIKIKDTKNVIAIIKDK